MPQVFISYAFDDRPLVQRELAGLLTALGCNVWFAEDRIRTAEQWEREILTALQASDWFIVVATANSAKSEYVRDEVNWAFSNMPNAIVPVVFDDCKLEEFHIRLPRIQCLDYRKDPNRAREQLISRFVAALYQPTNYQPKKRAHIAGDWYSFWEPRLEVSEGWAMEKVTITTQASQHVLQAAQNTHDYRWVGKGSFLTPFVFSLVWSSVKEGSESEGVGTLYRNTQGNHLVGHWYGPNGEGVPSIGRWILTHDLGSASSVCRKWFGEDCEKRLADSMK